MAVDYEVGGLLVKLQGNSSSLVKSINNTVKSLSNLSKGLQEINNVSLKGLTSKFTTMATAMNKFANSFNEGTVKRLRSISTSMYQMGNSFKVFTNMNVDLIGMNFKRLANQIDPFLKKLKESEPLLEKFNYTLDAGKLLARTNQRKKTMNKKASFWDNLWKIGKLDYFSRTLTRIARKLGEIFTMGAEFNETLNKFQSATRDNYQDAIKFARDLAKSFGLAEETIMNYQATFVNMLNSLKGLSSEVANELGQSLTIMAIDYASLFNTTIENAMNAFQSVLSGRTTAIRSASGIDVTQNTIYEYYKELYEKQEELIKEGSDKALFNSLKELGTPKSLNSLTQLEKRLLRVLAVYEQMNEAMALGDYKETLESYSNQARILSEQFKEIGVWFSNVFIGALSGAMPIVNGLAIALKEVLKSMAYLFGYEQQEAKKGLIDLSEESKNLGEGLGEVNDELKEMQGLLSFDKFNVLGTSASDSGLGSDITLILSSLNEKTKSLQEAMEGIELKANKIAENILKWLGFVDDVKETTNELGQIIDTRIVKVLKDDYTNFERLLNVFITIGSMVVIAGLKKLVSVIISLATATGSYATSLAILQKAGIFVLIYSLTTLITQWEDLNAKSKALYISLMAVFGALVIIANFEKIKSAINNISFSLEILKNSINLSKIAMLGIVSIGIVLIANMDKFSNKARTWIGVLGILTGALLGIATAIIAVKSGLTSLTAPMALGAITSFAVGVVAINKNLQNSTKIGAYATGGFPEQGQLFIANEQGPEMIGSMGGKTTVANNYQIEQGIEEASYRGFVRAMNSSSSQNKLVIDGKNVNDSALIRALMPAFRLEQSRTGGR